MTTTDIRIAGRQNDQLARTRIDSMDFSDNPEEKQVYDVFFRNRKFIEKFVDGVGGYGYSDSNKGRSFSFIDDQFVPESIELIRRFNGIGNQTFVYAAEGPVNYYYRDDNPKGETEMVFLTCKGIHILDSEKAEINILWSDIDSFDGRYNSWFFYKGEGNKRELLGSVLHTTLVGGSLNSYTKKWSSIFRDVIGAAKNHLETVSDVLENLTHNAEAQDSLSSIQDMSSKQAIISAYNKLQCRLAETIEEVDNLTGINSQFSEIQNRIAQALRCKVGEADEELSSALHFTTWDNLVIAFFGETNAGKSTIIETFRILFDENRNKEDGLIVGDGRHDFTKTYEEYKLSIDGVPFTLIDVPGIEGNEDDFKDIIKTALHKAHCVFYVQGHNKKPDTATAGKIKKYLGDWVKVYSVYNVRGGVSNYDEKEERETLLTPGVRKTEELIKSEFKDILGQVYAGHISIQGLLAMSSKACFSPEREDLIRGQRKLLNYFDGSVDKILQFSQFQTLVNVVESKAANFKQEIIESNKQKLISLAGKIGVDMDNEKKSTEETLVRLEDSLRNIRSEICNNRLSNAGKNIEHGILTAIDRAYGDLKSRIFNLIDSKPDHINERANALQREILGKLPYVVGDIVRKELGGIKDSANRKIKNLDGVKLKPLKFNSYVSDGVGVDFSGAFENLDIDFDRVSAWVGKTAGTSATGAAIGTIFGPVGTFVVAGIGAVIGGILSTKTANDGKSYARKEVSEAIAKAKGMTKNDIDRSLMPVYNDINNQNQRLKKAIKSELDNIDDLRCSLENLGERISGYVKKLNAKQYGRV